MERIQIDKNITVPLRDGVRLATNFYRPAINRIFHDAAHPSRLILPIIERKTGE